jgi:O-antigen ligase
MRTLRSRLPLEAEGLVAVSAAVVAAAAAIYAGHRYGPLAAGGTLVGLVAVLLLLVDGRVAVLLTLTVAIVAEEDPSWGISVFAKIYSHVPSAFEVLEGAAVVAVLVYLVHRRLAPRFPQPLAAVTVLVAVALAAGIVTGVNAAETGGRSAYVSALQTISPLFVIPFLVVNVVRTTEQLRLALAIGLGLAAVKALLGLFVVVSKLAPDQVGLGRLTYYHPASNMLLMLTLIGVLVAALSRTRVPRWVWWTAPLVFVCLLLSYRRAFWLGTALAALLVLFPASGRVGRRLVVPAAVVVGLFVYLAVGTGLTGDLQGTITQRIASINPASLQRNQEDRYRIDERKNVWAAIRQEPITGIGLGTEWQTQYPLGIEYPDGHLYVHLAALWWWMKMGLLGLAAYVLLIGSTIVTGVRVWLRHVDKGVRAFGLAAAGFAVGMVIVELTSTVIGPNERGTLVFALVLGLLASANAQIARQAGVSSKLGPA